jgi:proteasome lid subunit RPN8/RPN11
MISITDKHLEIIYSHAEQIYPEECCGILLGVICGSEKKCIQVITTENAWNTIDTPEEFANHEINRDKRYTIAPKDLLSAQKKARDNNLNIIGIFHSHTDASAVPSEFDRKYAWHTYSYIIVSVCKAKICDIRSWCLDTTHQFQEEVIKM